MGRYDTQIMTRIKGKPMRPENQIQRSLQALQQLPPAERIAEQTRRMAQYVPFLATTGLRFDELEPERVRVSVANQAAVQNHIGGIHACVMALLAETATGFVTMLNTPDDKLILLKSMHLRYTRRSQGAMFAVAELSAARAALLAKEERGSLVIPCRVYDESGEAPLEVEMTWAWLPKSAAG